jgi:hypothetical protein
MRATAAPAFSVVMSTMCEEAHLATLRSVAARCKELGADVVVALPAGATYDALRDEWNIRLVSVPDDATPSEVRRLAMAHATGDIVLVLEWSVLAEDDWCDRIRQYEVNSRPGAGSENGRRKDARLDWAEFLAVRGVLPADCGGALEPSPPTLAPDPVRVRSALTRWTEHLASAERARPAAQ